MAHKLLVGTRKGLFTFERAGGTWDIGARDFLGDPVAALLPDSRDGSVYASLALGHFGNKLRRRSTGGAWSDVAMPAFPEKPADVEDAAPWAVQLLWSLAAGGGDEPGVLWAGTIPGGLFRSEDGGGHWSLNEPLWTLPNRPRWMGGGYDHAGIHSICVDPRDSRSITVAVSIGGVWHTDDGGERWAPRCDGLRADYVPPELAGDPDQQDPHRVVQCPGAPDTLWMQHHNGMWTSSDRGRQWRELAGVAPSVFGFAVAAHPTDPRRAWFVPAQKDETRIPVNGALVVNRTDDGGRSFTTFTSGLPQHDAYDLVYRHGLDVAADGETLAFGSTTGGLWLSENGGEHWQTLSTHLPPIYCVRFAEG